MPLTREQREKDRLKSAINWNDNELAKRAADDIYIKSEFRPLELKAHRLKLNAHARWRREVKRRLEASEQQEKLLREEETKVLNTVVMFDYYLLNILSL